MNDFYIKIESYIVITEMFVTLEILGDKTCCKWAK